MEELIQTRLNVVYLCGPSPEGKFYVGQSRDFAARCRSHSTAQGGCPNFHAAIRRFGWSSLPVRFVAQTDSEEEADQWERRAITQYNALYPHGYNMTTGGRTTRFDPDARPDPSFKESPVTSEELAAEGQWRLAHLHEFCPVCGEFCSCGVDAAFGASALAHILSGEPAANYELSDSVELRQSLLASVDVGWLISLSKEYMDVRNATETLPVVAIQYVERLTPFVQLSLRRSVLAKRGLPSFTQGKLRIFPGSKADALVFLSVARGFRRAVRDLGETLASRVNVFHQLLGTYGTNPAKETIATQVLSLRGASPTELAEALADAALLRELHATGLREFAAVMVAFPDREERDRTSDGLLFGGDLRGWSSSSGKPSINVSKAGQSIGFRILIFHSLEARRDYVRMLLVQTPPQRMIIVRAAVTEPGVEVQDLALKP